MRKTILVASALLLSGTMGAGAETPSFTADAV